MKCTFAIALLALFAVASATSQPVEPEKIEPAQNVEPQAQDAAARDKRGVFWSYSSPIAYTSFPASIGYTSYSVPYAYRYPYYFGSYYP